MNEAVFFRLARQGNQAQEEKEITMFKIQREFLAVSSNANIRLLAFLRRKRAKFDDLFYKLRII